MDFAKILRGATLAAAAAVIIFGSAANAESPHLSAANFAARILAVHNAERAAHGEAPLTWDPSLEAGAASYAAGLAFTGAFQHSDRHARPGIGENLWEGSRGYYSLEQMIGGWASEKRVFVPGIFPAVSRTGNWEDVGHYTQMVWPTTTRVGCALASGRNDVLVCRYASAGNIDGHPVR
jgi:hypothetical protein